MTGGNYLQVAASNVKQAAQAMYRDIGSMRTSLKEQEKEVRRQVDMLKQQVHRNNLEMGSARDDTTRGVKLRENTQIQQQITDLEHQLVDLKRQTDSNIAGLEQQIQSLNQQAGNLQTLATQS